MDIQFEWEDDSADQVRTTVERFQRGDAWVLVASGLGLACQAFGDYRGKLDPLCIVLCTERSGSSTFVADAGTQPSVRNDLFLLWVHGCCEAIRNLPDSQVVAFFYPTLLKEEGTCMYCMVAIRGADSVLAALSPFRFREDGVPLFGGIFPGVEVGNLSGVMKGVFDGNVVQ